MTHIADAPAAVPAHAPAPEPPPDAQLETLGQTRHEPKVRPWELELLISGAVVFGLLQFPGQLDGWLDRAVPRQATGALAMLVFLYAYLKLILYTLIGSFLLHLTVRAYWVGMIGLESVFPHGIRWDKTQGGPVGREVHRERVPSLQAVIDRADRFASVIFSVAFLMVVLFALSIVYAGALWVVALGLSRLFPGTRVGVLMYVLGALLLLPGTLLVWVDKRFGERLDPEGRPRRVLRRLLLANYYAMATWIFGPTLLTLFSNIPKKVIYPLFFAVMYALIGLVIVKDVWMGLGALTADGYAYLPDTPGRYGVEGGYYEDRRRPGEVYTLPSIPSEVARGPYVRLFIPYAPGRHDLLFARRCDGVRPFRESGPRLGDNDFDRETDAHKEAVLRCWTRVQPVRVNGAPVTAPLRFHSDPVSGIRGVVAHLPTAGLPRGENVITVERIPPKRELEGGAEPTPRPPHYIPFWL